MTAIFRMTQGAGVGEWGIARQDLTLVGVGGSITLEAQDLTHASYAWEIISEPEGSTAAASLTPTGLGTATFDLDVDGGCLVRLRVDAGLDTEAMLVCYAGVPLPNSGLCIPAFNETFFDNSYAAGGSGDTYTGYERKITAFFKWADAAVGGAAGLFEEPALTTQSTSRIGSGAVFLPGSDDSFAHGEPIAAFGLNPNIISAGAVAPFTFIFGSANTVSGPAAALTNAGYAGNLVAGADNQVESEYSYVYGTDNTVIGVGIPFVGFTEGTHLVVGHTNVVDGEFLMCIGLQNTVSDGANIVMGMGNVVEGLSNFTVGLQHLLLGAAGTANIVFGMQNQLTDGLANFVAGGGHVVTGALNAVFSAGGAILTGGVPIGNNVAGSLNFMCSNEVSVDTNSVFNIVFASGDMNGAFPTFAPVTMTDCVFVFVAGSDMTLDNISASYVAGRNIRVTGIGSPPSLTPFLDILGDDIFVFDSPVSGVHGVTNTITGGTVTIPTLGAMSGFNFITGLNNGISDSAINVILLGALNQITQVGVPGPAIAQSYGNFVIGVNNRMTSSQLSACIGASCEVYADMVFTIGSGNTVGNSASPGPLVAPFYGCRSFVYGVDNACLGEMACMLGADNVLGSLVYTEAPAFCTVLGYGHTVYTHFAYVFGGDNIAYGDPTADVGYVCVFGRTNAVYGNDTFVSGDSNVVGSFPGDSVEYSAVFGYANLVTATGGLRNCFVAGEDIEVAHSGVTALGTYDRSVWDGALTHASGQGPGSSYNNTIVNLNIGAVTTNAAWTDLENLISGAPALLPTAPRNICVCEMHVIAKRPDQGGGPYRSFKTWVVRFTALQDGISGAYVFAPIDKTVINMSALSNESTWDVDVDIDTSDTDLPIRVRVKGEVGYTLHWVASLRVTRLQTPSGA